MSKVTNVSILRNGVRMPVIPAYNSDIASANNTHNVVIYDVATKTFRIGPDVIHVEDLIITGDIEVQESAMFRNDVSIAGDLYVDGQEHINDSETVQTTGDYFILRHNNGTPLGVNEKSGIAVFNYATNKTATLTVDKDGTWRIADNTATSTVHTNLYYFDGHYYNTSFVEQTFIDEIKTAFDEDEIGNCVFYNNNSFYHFDGTHWFAVSLVDNHLITDSTEITDATLIAALELLDKKALQYFRRLQITQISEIENEPLLTRDEEANMTDSALLKWNATDTKAETITAPTQNNTYLRAKVNAGADYHWQAITFAATGYAAMLYDFPENDDTVFMDLELKQGTKPTPVPSQATTITHNYTDFLYYTETDKVVYYDADADKYYEVFFNSDGTCTVDQYQTIIGDPTKLVTCTISSEKIDNVHGTFYDWANGGGTGVSFIGTRAQYEVAKLIPEGADGFIPANSLVIITDEDNNTIGDER